MECRVILAVDVGVDDYLALLLFLLSAKLKQCRIEAIVCSSGNTNVENVCTNVVRLLEIVGRTDIPIYRGAPQHLITPTQELETYYGLDGFGDLKHDSTPDLSIIRKEPAAQAIADLVSKHPHEISLICLAALTDLALAIRLYGDEFTGKIKDLWIMGGSYQGVGNVSPTAEFNFFADPEAAQIVLESVKKPIFLGPWEMCLLQEISFKWRFEVFGATKKPAIQLLNKADKSIQVAQNQTSWIPCDAFVAAAFLHPEIITKQEKFYATVELHGSHTRGQLILDHLKQKPENIAIIEDVNLEAFKELLLQLKD